jgi:hypothetical protein
LIAGADRQGTSATRSKDLSPLWPR